MGTVEEIGATVPDGFEPFFRSSPFLDLVGPLYQRLDDGGLVLALRIEPRHTNRRGLAHGGLLVTLADLVLGYTAGHGPERPPGLITVNLTVDFAGSARTGDWVEARADVQKVGGSLAFANCYVTVGSTRIVRASAVFKVAAKAA